MNQHSSSPAAARSCLIDWSGEQARDIARILSARRGRRHFFPGHLFGEPCWEMLLTLALAELEQRRVTVSALCSAAGVPNTTAARYVLVLVEAGIVTCTEDGLDRRRRFVSLTPAAAEQLARYFEAHPLTDLKAA